MFRFKCLLFIPWFVRVWADENILITTSSNWTLNAFQTKHWMNEFVCNNGYTLQMLNTKCQLINAIILWIQLNKNKTKSTQSKCTISCEWKELLFFVIDNHGFGIGFLYHAVLCNICTSPQNDAHRKLRIESIPLNTKWFHQNRKRRNRSETSCECNLHNSNMKSMKLHWMCMVKAFRIFVCERKVCAIRCVLNMHSMHPIFSVQNNIQYSEYRVDMYVRSHRFSIYFFRMQTTHLNGIE